MGNSAAQCVYQFIEPTFIEYCLSLEQWRQCSNGRHNAPSEIWLESNCYQSAAGFTGTNLGSEHTPLAARLA